jgi:hypothetical protein
LAHGANVDEANFEPRRSGGWPVLKRVAWMLGLGLCLLSCVVTLAFAAGSLLDPASSIYAMSSSFAWPLLGPHLTVLTLVCLLVAVVAARRGPRILSWTSVCVAGDRIAVQRSDDRPNYRSNVRRRRIGEPLVGAVAAHAQRETRQHCHL